MWQNIFPNSFIYLFFLNKWHKRTKSFYVRGRRSLVFLPDNWQTFHWLSKYLSIYFRLIDQIHISLQLDLSTQKLCSSSGEGDQALWGGPWLRNDWLYKNQTVWSSSQLMLQVLVCESLQLFLQCCRFMSVEETNRFESDLDWLHLKYFLESNLFVTSHFQRCSPTSKFFRKGSQMDIMTRTDESFLLANM